MENCFCNYVNLDIKEYNRLIKIENEVKKIDLNKDMYVTYSLSFFSKNKMVFHNADEITKKMLLYNKEVVETNDKLARTVCELRQELKYAINPIRIKKSFLGNLNTKIKWIILGFILGIISNLVYLLMIKLNP